MRHKILKALAVVAIMTVTLVGPTLAADPIHLGLVGIITGPNAQNGEYSRNGAQLAVDEINAKGGVKLPGANQARLLELVVVDDQAKPDIALNAIRKLVSDETVLAFLGCDYSGLTYPTLFVGEEAGIAQITSSIAAKITQENYKHILRGRSNDEMWMKALVDYVVGKLGKKKIGISYTNIELGKSGKDVAIKYLKEKYNITPVVEVAYGFGDRDLSASAGQIKIADPEVLINWGTQIEAALLVRDLRNLGWKGIFSFNAADDIFVDLAKENAVGVIGPQNWVWTKDDPKSKAFSDAYEKKFGKRPSPHSVVYYDGVYLLKAAIEKDGANREKILSAIKSMDKFEGVQGKFAPSSKNGDMVTATVIIDYDSKLTPKVAASIE
jgi:branched-chain amino acid transport system substrate-binding protein